MSNQKQQNPEIDFGFYATTPRIVRTGYKDLTPTQKWIYTCIKDLCGDKGTCYRTLRVLSEETNISTGMLSESIPVLHKAGLIHAEKKKRASGGKEVWHITVVDIWQENGKAHPTKRSQNEQSLENADVHEMNVHHVNELPPECSQNERECSQIRHRSNNNKAIPSEERTESNSAHVAHANAQPTHSEILQRLSVLEAEREQQRQENARILDENALLKAQLEQLSTSHVYNQAPSVDTHNEVPQQTTADDILHAAGMPVGEQNNQSNGVSDSHRDVATTPTPVTQPIAPPSMQHRTIPAASQPHYEPAQQTLPDSGEQPTKRRGSRKKKETDVSELSEEERAHMEAEKAVQEALKTRHKDIYTKIVARRGCELVAQKDIINEWNSIHKLADKYTNAQIDRIHKYLFEEHSYWSQTDHKYDIGAYVIWKNAGAVAQILRERRQQKSEHASSSAGTQDTSVLDKNRQFSNGLRYFSHVFDPVTATGA